MGSIPDGDVTATTQTFVTDCLLFDFDGTIIDSTAAIVKHWHKIGNEIGVDPNLILATSHGRRSIDVLKLYDPSKANWDYISEAEGQIPKVFGSDAVEIPGARKLLQHLDGQNVPWAVVTSGTRNLVSGWLDVLELARPKTMVVAEDVENGKPDPACYLLGRARLDLKQNASAVVFEDAPSGVKAGKAAGFVVVGLATTHTISQLQEAGADCIVQDLRSISVTMKDDRKIGIEVRNNVHVE